MSLVKMSPSSWRYYAEEIALGREDYYAAAAEHPGRFVGRGAAALGLSPTEVSAEGLERLFGHGTDPRTGAALGRSFSAHDPSVVAGFAVTFSAPKSVSVLWACGDEATRAEVLAAHDAAMREALAFLDDHAAFTRRGHAGVHQVDTDGLIGAGFTHRTSRAADPQPHTHVLLANKVHARDGAWLSLDAREFYEHQKAAGMLYKAALRAELTNRLGLAWTAVDDNGVAEIVGVPQALCEHWSTRRHEVEETGAALVAEREAELGRALSANERAVCFQLAAYHTRAPKLEANTPTAELTARWHAEAIELGLEPEGWLPDVSGRQRTVATVPDAELVAQAIPRLGEGSATWGRSDAVEVLSTLVTAGDAAAVRTRVESLAEQLLSDQEVCSLAGPLPAEPPSSLRRHDGMSVIERHGGQRFTTRTTLINEATVLDAIAAGRDARSAAVPTELVERVLEPSLLGEDQRQAVRSLLGGGEQVALLVGPAGAGKSRALEAARAGWEAAGYEVIGLAPSAMAAVVLGEQAGIRSETLARFLLDQQPVDQASRLGPRSVVVLDEASMARSDDLARLVRLTSSAGAKLVLVGDHRQLGAVGPGGVFATLVGDHGAHELETLHRFEHAWEAAASLRLRAGDTAILPVYLRHGRIEGGSREQVIEAALCSWRQARDEGFSVLLMVGDNATADDLSRRCRAELVARGEVERDGVALGKGRAGVGDEIVTLRNDRRLRPGPDDFVRNGERWRVTARQLDGALEVASLEGRGTVVLPPDYVARHVALGYGLTIHKAQGSTTDRAIVVVDEQMSAEQLYVAMSRGRTENRALVICSDDERDEHAPRRRLDAVQLLVKVMRRPGAERSAHEVLRRGLERFEDVELLSELLAEAEHTIGAGAGPDHRLEIAALAARADVEAARAHLLAAEEAASRATQRREAAEALSAGVEHRSLRALLPGRLGNEQRNRESNRSRATAGVLGAARRDEQRCLRALGKARQDFSGAEQAARQLGGLRTAQERRNRWLAQHSEELRWARELRARHAAAGEERAIAEVVRRGQAQRGRTRAAAGEAAPCASPSRRADRLPHRW